MPHYQTPLGLVYLTEQQAATYREQPCVRVEPKPTKDELTNPKLAEFLRADP